MKRFRDFEEQEAELRRMVNFELDASDDSDRDEVHHSDHNTNTDQSEGDDVEEEDTPVPPGVKLPPDVESLPENAHYVSNDVVLEPQTGSIQNPVIDNSNIHKQRW